MRACAAASALADALFLCALSEDLLRYRENRQLCYARLMFADISYAPAAPLVTLR